MKNIIKIIVAICLSCAVMINVIYAVSTKSNSWDIDESGSGENGKHEIFWPKTGTLTATYYSEYANTKIIFTYGSKTANGLGAYRDVDLYPGIEIRDYSDGAFDNFSAYSITTNLPDPQKDMENDDLFGDRNEEAEVTALGAVSADKEYYMNVNWTDYRDGSTGGSWGAKAELSSKGLLDYNVEDYKYLHTDVTYGSSKGTKSISDLTMNENNSTSTTIPMNALPATVTFNDYLSFDEFTSLLNKTTFTIVQLQLRGLSSDGDRITIFSRIDKGLEETKAILMEQADKDDFTILGITAMYVYAEANQIEALKNNEYAYMVDVVDTNTEGATSTSQYDVEVVEPKCVFAHPLTWQLEDAGLLGQGEMFVFKQFLDNYF